VTLPEPSPGSAAPLNGLAALDVHERVRLMRDGVINHLGLVVSALAGLILVPVLLRGLGPELYGLWITALTLAGLGTLIDFGLYSVVSREVAGILRTGLQEETTRFVCAAWQADLLLGLMGGGVIAAIGFFITGSLHLAIEGQKIAPLVFLLVGGAFAAERLQAFAITVLLGLRRFDAVNLVSSATVVVRAVGILLLLAAGAGLLAIAAWHVVAAALGAVAAYTVVRRLAPPYRLRPGLPRWRTLRAHVSFGLASQLAAASIKLAWETAPVIIGVLLGTARVVPYYIGQRFPLAASGFAWHAAGVSFPAASEYQREEDQPRRAVVLEVVSRWVLLFMLPLCSVLYILAPDLLRVWIGNASPEAVVVMRLTTTAVFFDAIGVGALYVLWGWGAARIVSLVTSGVAVAALGLGVWLLTRLGIVGMAWGLLPPVLVGAIVLLRTASHTCGVSLPRLTKSILSGLLLPFTTCVATTLALSHFFLLNSWIAIIGASLAGGGVYAAGLYLWGAREEEHLLARELFHLPAVLVDFAYRGLRRGLQSRRD